MIGINNIVQSWNGGRQDDDEEKKKYKPNITDNRIESIVANWADGGDRKIGSKADEVIERYQAEKKSGKLAEIFKKDKQQQQPEGETLINTPEKNTVNTGLKSNIYGGIQQLVGTDKSLSSFLGLEDYQPPEKKDGITLDVIVSEQIEQSNNRINEIDQQLNELLKVEGVTKDSSIKEKFEALRNNNSLSTGISGNTTLGSPNLYDEIDDELASKLGIDADKQRQYNQLVNEKKFLKDAVNSYTEYSDWNEKDKGIIGNFFTGMKDIIKGDFDQLVPFERYAHTAQEAKDLKEVLVRYEAGDELSPAETAKIESFKAEMLNQSIDRGISYQVGNMLIQMPTFMIEFAMTSGLQSGGAKGLKTLLSKTALNETVANIGANLFGSLVQTGGFAPSIDSKTAEYMLPEYQLVTTEEGDLAIEKLDEGDDFAPAFAKAFGTTYTEVASENLFELTKNPLIDDIGVAVAGDKEGFLKKAILGKFLKGRNITAVNTIDDVISKYAGWDGLLQEIGEEEFTEFANSFIEGREWKDPLTTPEGRERFLVEFLGIGAFSGLSKLPVGIQQNLSKTRTERESTPIKIDQQPVQTTQYEDQLSELMGGEAYKNSTNTQKLEMIDDFIDNIAQRDPEAASIVKYAPEIKNLVSGLSQAINVKTDSEAYKALVELGVTEGIDTPEVATDAEEVYSDWLSYIHTNLEGESQDKAIQALKEIVPQDNPIYQTLDNIQPTQQEQEVTEEQQIEKVESEGNYVTVDEGVSRGTYLVPKEGDYIYNERNGKVEQVIKSNAEFVGTKKQDTNIGVIRTKAIGAEQDYLAYTNQMRPATQDEIELAKTELNTKIEQDPLSDLENDIDISVATQAFENTSFTPEKRGEQRKQEYIDTIKGDYAELKGIAKTVSQKRILADMFPKYRAGYRERINSYFHSHAKVASTAITGGSNFPTARNEKRGRNADNKITEAIEFRERMIKNIKNKLDPKSIRGVGENQLEQLKKKVEYAEKSQERMKEANKIIKKGKDVEAKLKEAGFDSKTITEILKPDYMGRTGFASYVLRNNNAEIKRLKSRIEEMTNKINRQNKGENEEYSFEGGNVIMNYEANRIQIDFKEKPDAGIRDDLKRNGFKWSPKNKVWQRQITDNAIRDTQVLLGINLNPDNISTEDIAKHISDITEELISAIENPAKRATKIDEDGNRAYYRDGVGYPAWISSPSLRNKQLVEKVIDAFITGKKPKSNTKARELYELANLEAKQRAVKGKYNESQFNPSSGELIANKFISRDVEPHTEVLASLALGSDTYEEFEERSKGVKDNPVINEKYKSKQDYYNSIINKRNKLANLHTSVDTTNNIGDENKPAQTPEQLANRIDQFNKVAASNAILRKAGGVKSKNAKGEFAAVGEQGEIRLKKNTVNTPSEYLSTLSHELAHAVEYQILKSVNKDTYSVFGDSLDQETKDTIESELKEITKNLIPATDLKKRSKYYNQSSELFARFMEMMVINYDYAQDLAPTAINLIERQQIKHPIVKEYFDAINNKIDEKVSKSKFMPDMKQLYINHLGKLNGTIAYNNLVAHRAMQMRARKAIEELLKDKFKNVKDDPSLLFRVAESIKITRGGEPEFGTRDFLYGSVEPELYDTLTTEQAVIDTIPSAKELIDNGYELVKDGNKFAAIENETDGKMDIVFARQRYTVEEGEAMYNQLSKEGRKLINDFTSAREEAKDYFNREILKDLKQVESNIEGWVHHYHPDKGKGDLSTSKDKFKSKVAGFRKKRMNKEGYIEDLRIAMEKSLIDGESEKVYNDFITRQFATVTKPIDPAKGVEKGWIEVMGNLTTGVGRGVETKGRGARYQMPRAIYKQYELIGGLAEEGNKVLSVLNGANRLWKINVLVHPGTAMTNLESGGNQFALKVMNDFYTELLTGQTSMKQTRKNISAMISVLFPKGWKNAPDWTYGGDTSNLYGSSIGKSRYDSWTDTYAKYALKFFGGIERYWKKVIATASDVQDLNSLGELTKEGLQLPTREEIDMIGRINEEIDMYAYDYDNIAPMLDSFNRAGGGILTSVKPFMTYQYKRAKMWSNFIGAIFDRSKPWQERTAKLLTVTTLMGSFAFLKMMRDREKETPDPVASTPARLSPRGRFFLGTDDDGNEVFVRTAKYPIFAEADALIALTQGDYETAGQIFTDMLGSIGPIGQAFLNVTGYVNEYDKYAPKEVVAGRLLSGFIPAFRIFNDVARMFDPYKRKEETFGQAFVGRLIPTTNEDLQEKLHGEARTTRIPIEGAIKGEDGTKRTTVDVEMLNNRNDIMISLLSGIYLTRIDPEQAEAFVIREQKKKDEKK